MGVKFNPFSSTLELTEGTHVYLSNGAPPTDVQALWVDTSETAGRASAALLQMGTEVRFDVPIIFNSPEAPGTAWEITCNLTEARAGIVQKLYHRSPISPKLPFGWVQVRDTEYLRDALNIIYAEWVNGVRVEYWVVQEFNAVYRFVNDFDGTYYCPQQTPDYTITYDVVLG